MTETKNGERVLGTGNREGSLGTSAQRGSAKEFNNNNNNNNNTEMKGKLLTRGRRLQYN